MMKKTEKRDGGPIAATATSDSAPGSRARFDELADQWRRETRNLSSTTDKLAHPAYREIVEMGPQVIPWIIARLRDGSRHWFFALNELSGVNPVDASLENDLPAMIRAWEQWIPGRTKARNRKRVLDPACGFAD